MKIDGFDGVSRPKPAEGPGNQPRVARQEEAGQAPSPGDRVELSDRAREVATLAEKSASLADVRREKVEAVREAIEAGTYRVDPRQVARSILEYEDGFPLT